MKITFLNGWLLCAISLLVSCDGSNNKDGGGKSGSSQSDKKTASCLAKFDHDYSKLLTKEDVLKHISIAEPEALEMNFDAASVERHPEYGDVSYSWPSDRPDVQISPSFPVKHPDLNTITLSNLVFKDGDIAEIQGSFHTAFRGMTQEEIDASKARIEEFYKDKPAEELAGAKKFLEARGESSNEPVEGVGDYAYWFPITSMDLYYGSKVVVLVGNAQFELTAKVSDNDEENLEVAKKIALEVLAKCK